MRSLKHFFNIISKSVVSEQVPAKKHARTWVCLLFDLDLNAADASFHFGQVAQHLEGILEDADLGLTVVDDLDGGLHDGLAQLGCPEDGLEIKGEAVDLATGEDLPHRLAGEGLTAALGIGQLEAAEEAEHLDIDLGGQLADVGS